MKVNPLYRTLALALSAACILNVSAGEPAVIWTSQPVEPGEAVMVFGGPWTSIKSIELEGPEKSTVEPLRVTDDCVTFVYPPDWPRTIFTARITDASGIVETVVNAPDIWWLQGDMGSYSTPGGWLRVFGRSIGYGKEAGVMLMRGAETIKLPAETCDLYSMSVSLAPDLAPGEYAVSINNGLSKTFYPAGTLTVSRETTYWADKIFNVMEFGAVPNDRIDDSHAIRAALEAIKKNGGGILHFPRGRFGMSGTLELPPHTLLRGETAEQGSAGGWKNGREDEWEGTTPTPHSSTLPPIAPPILLSQIYWIDEDDPRGPLVRGTHDFGIEDIFLASGNITVGIEAAQPGPADEWKSENILLRRVRTRFLHTDTMSKEEAARRLQTKGHPVVIAGSKNVRILDCDFHCSKNGASHIGPTYGIVRGNRLEGLSYIGGRQVIFEDNDCDGAGFSFSPVSRNYYFARNKFGNVRGDGDRETFTFDGGRTTHNGPVAAVREQGLTLPPGAWRDGADSWIGETVSVIGGKGAGQMRLITKIEGRNVELDEPWDIVPDTESYIVVGLQRQKLLLIDNYDGDGNPFQLYGSAANVVLAGNRMDGNGMHAFGMTKGNSPEPSWFIQFLDNEILEGNSVRGPWSYMVPAADAYIGFFDRGIRKPLTYPLNRVGIMRRNVLHSNAHLYAGPKVENMLVENNVVRRSDKGAVVLSKGAVVRGNRFDDVVRPYQVRDDAVLDPAERLRAALGTVETVCAEYLPATWDELTADADKLAGQPLSGADKTEAVRNILLRSVRALSDSLDGKPVPSAVIENLLGLDLKQPSPWFLARIGTGSITQAKFPIGTACPVWGLPSGLAAEAGPLGNWEARVETPATIAPGERVAVNLLLNRPGDRPTVLTLPVRYTLTGDGWTLNFSETYTWDKLSVTQFLAAGPFKNASGKGIDTQVHPPEINLDVTQSYATMDGNRPWVPVKPDDKGKISLASSFEHTELATVHLAAVVRAEHPLRVYVNYGSNSSNLAFVNGDRIGSSARRPGPALAELNKGDNLLHIISSNSSGDWPITVELTVLDPVQPGDLEIVPAGDLFASPLLTPQGGKIPEGAGLPHSLGVDWKLVHSDNFNRMRLGDSWSCKSPGWMAQMATIRNHALEVEAGWGFLTWESAIKPPVRIEADVTYKGYMVGAYLCPEGLSWRHFWGRGNASGEGRGYCLSLGWHDTRNNRVLRDSETVLLDEKGWIPKEGDTFHMTAQFLKDRYQLFVDGKLVMEYNDPESLSGLDRVGLFSFSGSSFDNVRIYLEKEVEPQMNLAQ